MSRDIYDLIGLAAAACFILALKGLSHPRTTRVAVHEAVPSLFPLRVF